VNDAVAPLATAIISIALGPTRSCPEVCLRCCDAMAADTTTGTTINGNKGNPWRPKQRSLHRPHTSFALADGYVAKPAKREEQLYDGCGSVQGMAFAEAQKIAREERMAKEEEKRMLDITIR
jgi:hypothetical protein